MRTFAIQVAFISVFLQVSSADPACLIVGTIASCAFQKHHQVPALPPNITHLYLEMNLIRELDETSLSGLEELQVLDVGRQLVPLLIRNNTFSRQRNLVRLVLGFNVGLQLEPKAFAGLSGLKVLDLDYCTLHNSILRENYLEPLSSLESLNLFGNHITRLQPSLFFSNLTKLSNVNLMLNPIDRVCEEDLAGFQGKHFNSLNMGSILLRSMTAERFDWKKCGNPFRGISFQTLDLSSNGFGLGKLKLFLKAIQGTRIAHLKLSGPIGRGFSFHNLPDPDRSTFEGLGDSAVQYLDLSKNRISALHQGVFSPVKEVRIIDVSRNKINQIGQGAFEGLQGHTQMLNLSHNLLGEVYMDTFAGLESLLVLDLSHNHIGALGFQSFSGLPNLKALYLTGNSLRDLGFPASLPSLKYLFLNDNRLTSSSVGSITAFGTNVTHLDLSENKFVNLGDVYMFLSKLKHLQSLWFWENTLRWCTPPRREEAAAGARPLQVLDLQSSSLQAIWSQGRCLDVLYDLGNLASLRLSSNGLQSLPEGIFRDLSSVVEIDLSSNALTRLQPNIFPQSLRRLDLSNNFIATPDPAAFRSLCQIDLTMNRFHCSPDLQRFLDWTKQTNVTFLRPMDELRCAFPPDLYDVPLSVYSASVH